jgi:hypothetical protein
MEIKRSPRKSVQRNFDARFSEIRGCRGPKSTSSPALGEMKFIAARYTGCALPSPAPGLLAYNIPITREQPWKN